ncbi:hypothetical protein BKA67DRAFT_141268 [Truncatella angustata]|uniref:Uncharacterized protein n=1 Tax=Truncatella angustata TaxID=152316 RepID=A0A9P8RHW5_9PEZI|nr:uncharacterized protein BKA67DRAFT_141268 [Truncatella angustata]KAH6640078.1 hypothetical protein BKA67DRAFT_141268 [Truncatella angustata]KAH8195116.1 hypothetical protein TruAng_010720 [Truncatella angustata]
MSSPRAQNPADSRTTSGNRSPSQYTFHLRTKSYSAPSPPTSSTTKRSNAQAHTSSYTANPSPLKMVTTSTDSHHAQNVSPYYYSSPGTDTQGYGWMQPIEIDDDDLLFGGKSLSEWHEEERRTVSTPAEEERRGRQRVRSTESSHFQSVLDANRALQVRQSHSYSSYPSKSKTTSSGEQKKH